MTNLCVLYDKTIGLKAIGVYFLLLDRMTRPGWKVSKEEVYRASGEGKRAFTGAWNTLKEHGYLEVNRVRKDGRLKWEYRLKTIPGQYILEGEPLNATKRIPILNNKNNNNAPLPPKGEQVGSADPAKEEKKAAERKPRKAAADASGKAKMKPGKYAVDIPETVRRATERDSQTIDNMFSRMAPHVTEDEKHKVVKSIIDMMRTACSNIKRPWAYFLGVLQRVLSDKGRLNLAIQFSGGGSHPAGASARGTTSAPEKHGFTERQSDYGRLQSLLSLA